MSFMNDAGNWLDEQASALTGASEARAKKAEQAALAKKLQSMMQAGNVLGQYRPEMMNARMNALRNRMSAYQGANNALATMYGKRNAQGFGQLTQNPMSPTMAYQGNAQIPGDHPMAGTLQKYLEDNGLNTGTVKAHQVSGSVRQASPQATAANATYRWGG